MRTVTARTELRGTGTLSRRLKCIGAKLGVIIKKYLGSQDGSARGTYSEFIPWCVPERI